MTQNTQTTQQRLRGMIGAYLQGEFYSLSTAFESMDLLSATIAAEIVRLTAERDEARAELIEVRDTLHHTNNEFAVILRERNDAHLALAEARAYISTIIDAPGVA